jgi:hypothetical protein
MIPVNYTYVSELKIRTYSQDNLPYAQLQYRRPLVLYSSNDRITPVAKKDVREPTREREKLYDILRLQSSFSLSLSSWLHDSGHLGCKQEKMSNQRIRRVQSHTHHPTWKYQAPESRLPKTGQR